MCLSRPLASLIAVLTGSRQRSTRSEVICSNVERRTVSVRCFGPAASAVTNGRLTWVWDHDPDNPQTIELKFSEQDGATTVLMINSGIPTERQRGEQQGGWHGCYDNLDRALREDPEQA